MLMSLRKPEKKRRYISGKRHKYANELILWRSNEAAQVKSAGEIHSDPSCLTFYQWSETYKGAALSYYQGWQ